MVSAVAADGTAVGHYVPRGRARSGVIPGEVHGAYWKEGKRIALPELTASRAPGTGLYGRPTSRGNGVSPQGTIVGECTAPDGKRACIWKGGKVQPLPTFKGFSASANAINRSGIIVGDAMERANRDGWLWLACIWREGRIHDLNKLIPENPGWTLSVASSINHRGMIVGWGTYRKSKDHGRRAFLLTPLDGEE
jgi:uncharacterized membrane protein